MIKKLWIAFFVLTTFAVSAQENSTHGWYLPTRDTLRVLMVFVEVDYDIEPELEVLPKGNDRWPKGELPIYADEVFDAHPHFLKRGTMTKYYDESSLGNFLVLGDYLPKLYRVKWSEIGSRGISGLLRNLSEQFKNQDTLVSKAGLKMKDFDFWKKTVYPGREKEKSGSEFDGVDHVMIFTRNFHLIPRDNGQASGSTMGDVGGKLSNTYSIFAGGHGFPFGILRHELNHLLLGGNNFHCCGGNSPRFSSYFPFVQGGWGMMGGANSSFLTCSGWDRYRLGWKHRENEFEISARNLENNEVIGDLTHKDGSGIYVLRDFATTGDALRIELPFIPENEFKQWLWIENHTTKDNNNSMFDVFQYEYYDCMPNAKQGLYMYMQVDADIREGTGIFTKVKADYLRPVLADGNYDYRWEDEVADLGYCVNNVAYYPYYVDPNFENPLTGNHAQEFPQFYTNETSELNEKTARVPHTRREGDTYERIALMGNPRNGFRTGEKTILGVGTNPSSANMLTLVNSRKPGRGSQKDNRSIYINGLKVEILETLADKSIVVQVSFDDNEIVENRRWCAPEIVLSNHISTGPDLIVKAHLQLDIGETMTRFDKPIEINGKKYFTYPTTLVIHPDAEMEVQKKVTLSGNSKLIVDGHLTVNRRARIVVENGSEIIINDGQNLSGKGKIKIKKGGVATLSNDKLKDVSLKIKPKRRVEVGL